jgi:lysozyme family protein
MQSVKEMIADILRREGGYVDDPADAGGATKHGISLRYARGLGLQMDLDDDGDVDEDDIRMVSPAQAAALYERDFLVHPKFDKLPIDLQPHMFDMSVNHGPARAAMILQGALNELGADLDEDGRIGPATRRALNAMTAPWALLQNAMVDERLMFYEAIVDRRPSQEHFLAGWRNRAEEFRIRD